MGTFKWTVFCAELALRTLAENIETKKNIFEMDGILHCIRRQIAQKALFQILLWFLMEMLRFRMAKTLSHSPI